MFTDLIDGENIRVVERGSALRFLSETPKAVGIAREGCRKKFDGDVSAKRGVSGTVDLAHTAST